ncbi:hypothetical protein [Elizabethkingia ursingii]|uniref:hypothetical protein n=1 Tax=Elizabethkingia ursingii TaxID=1756150 RepID=UPI0007509BED|nr:hypothetical protein [Elizabethkingia ursingii]KUY28524.1 hypothetical protein ATB96_19365 [Elizabethkingia ursingii]
MEGNNVQFLKITHQISSLEENISALISEYGAELDENLMIVIPPEIKASFIQKKEFFFTDIIKSLCISVLCGEYIEFPELFDRLGESEKKIEEFPNKTNDFPLDIQSQIYDISSAIIIVIEFYKDFIKEIENYYSEDRVKFLFQRNTLIQRELSKKTLHRETEYKINYFLNLLTITSIDHFPSTEDKYILEIFKAEEFIENFKNHSFRDLTNVIDEKIKFLKFKWKERRLQENPFMHSYLENGIHKKIGEYNTSNNELCVWKEVISTQYELNQNGWKLILTDRVKLYKNNSISSFIKSFELHQLIKYFKDVSSNDKKLEEISSKLLKDKENISSLNFYDKYAVNIFCNYALNNEFSSYIEKESSIENINSKYDDLNSKLSETTNNYFFKYRYLSRVLDILLPKINEIDKKVFIENYEVILDRCKSILNEYYENINWSLTNFNYIFLLPISESKVRFEIDGNDYDIFFASSFVLPPSSKKIKEDYSEVKEKFDKLYSYLDFSNFFSKEIDEIKAIKKELNDKEVKSIELLSLFTAVISFIIGGVSGFAFIKDLYTALLFFIVFTTSLLTFLLALFVCTRGKHVIKDNKKYIYWIYSMFFIAILLLFISNLIKLKFFNNKTDIERIEARLRNDSIKNLKKDLSIQNTYPVKVEIDTQKAPKKN